MRYNNTYPLLTSPASMAGRGQCSHEGCELCSLSVVTAVYHSKHHTHGKYQKDLITLKKKEMQLSLKSNKSSTKQLRYLSEKKTISTIPCKI